MSKINEERKKEEIIPIFVNYNQKGDAMDVMNSDTLRVNIFREVMALSEDKLRKVYDYIEVLASKKEAAEYVMPDDLIESVAEYTLKVAEDEGPLYSTTEVKDYVNKQMGWK